MNPEALLRNILQAAETKHAAVIKAEQDYSAALRQLLDKGVKTPEPADAQP